MKLWWTKVTSLSGWALPPRAYLAFGLFTLLLYLVGYKLMISQGKLMARLGIMAFMILIGSGFLSVILFARANEVKEEAPGRVRHRATIHE